MQNKRYESELKNKVIQLHLESGRTKKSLTDEYHLGQGTLTYWLQQYRKECKDNSTKQEELKKEIEFLKKAAAFFAKEIK